MQSKIEALAVFLNVSPSEIEPVGIYEQTFAYKDCEFLVVDSEEARELVNEQVDMMVTEDIPLAPSITYAEVLSDDGEENEEHGYLIYRQN